MYFTASWTRTQDHWTRKCCTSFPSMFKPAHVISSDWSLVDCWWLSWFDGASQPHRDSKFFLIISLYFLHCWKKITFRYLVHVININKHVLGSLRKERIMIAHFSRAETIIDQTIECRSASWKEGRIIFYFFIKSFSRAVMVQNQHKKNEISSHSLLVNSHFLNQYLFPISNSHQALVFHLGNHH